jgi:hypothetical protein
MDHGDFFVLIEGELVVQLSQSGGSGHSNSTSTHRHLCGTGEWFGEIDPSAEHTWNSPRLVKAVVPSVMLRASRDDFAEFLRTAGHASRRVVADAISQQALSILRKALPFAGMGDSRSRKDHASAAAKNDGSVASHFEASGWSARGTDTSMDDFEASSRSAAASSSASTPDLVDVKDVSVSAAGGVVSEEWAALHQLAGMMRFEAVPAGTEIGRWGFAEPVRGSERKSSASPQGFRLCGDNGMPLFGVVASGEVAVTAMLVGREHDPFKIDAEDVDAAARAASTCPAGTNGLLLYTLQEADVLATAPVGFGSSAQTVSATTTNLAHAFAHGRSSSTSKIPVNAAVGSAVTPAGSPALNRSMTTPTGLPPAVGSR